jgi:hypothetical protein
MTVLDNTPENKNFLSPLNFKFQIKKAPHVNFFIQKVNIPAISIPPPQPNNPFVKTPIPGEHVNFGDLMITFKVDEDLKNYLEIWNWIIALGKPENFDQYRQIYEKPSYTGEGIYSDISLMILSSTKMPNYEITYVDAFPVDLSQALFNTVDTDVNYIEASATFKYTYYTITNI